MIRRTDPVITRSPDHLRRLLTICSPMGKRLLLLSQQQSSCQIAFQFSRELSALPKANYPFPLGKRFNSLENSTVTYLLTQHLLGGKECSPLGENIRKSLITSAFHRHCVNVTTLFAKNLSIINTPPRPHNQGTVL